MSKVLSKMCTASKIVSAPLSTLLNSEDSSTAWADPQPEPRFACGKVLRLANDAFKMYVRYQAR